MSWALFLLATLAAFGLTGLLRRYALQRSLLDKPNARSSHTVATPRGGGMAFVLVFLSLLLVLWLCAALESDLMIALLGAGGGVAALGFADDHGHIAARWRLLGHFVAAAWSLFWLGGLPPVVLFGVPFDLGWVGHVLAAVFLVWLLNLYNFMDGIDGIAAVQAICAGGGAVLCYAAVDAGAFTLMAGGASELLLTCAVLGFLFWNFPRARIFMGDVGSGFLGIVIGILVLQATWQHPQLLWSWLILLGVFIVDATFTLFHRLLRGEAVYQAHRSHAYQVAARRIGRHAPVTVAVGLIVVVWLLPWAVGVALGGIDGATAMLIAYVPLLCLCIWFDAGVAETGG